MHGYNYTDLRNLSPVDIVARRHDLDINAALSMRTNSPEQLRQYDLADAKFYKSIQDLHRKGKISWIQYQQAKLVGGRLSRLLYRNYQKKLR